MIVRQDGTLMRDRGLYIMTFGNGTVVLSAVAGFTGRMEDSFIAAPIEIQYAPTALLEKLCAQEPDQELVSSAREEIAARQRKGFFHLIPAIQSMVPKEEWPKEEGEVLFIPTPQIGIEAELVERNMLEALVEEAASGDEQAQLLLTHIEEECSAPISEVISAAKSRVEQMMEDQAEQLRIHAEVVARAEQRGKIKAASAERTDEEAATASTHLSADSSAASSSACAVAPTSASSSVASSASSSSALSAHAAVMESPVPYSWTASRAYTSLANLCTAGRKKYSTITSAALRFLHTLRPVSVNRSGGSHTVFHFASGSPVTLVTPHGGDGTVSRHAATRLFAVLQEAALQQLSSTGSLAFGPAGRFSLEE